MKSIAEDLKTSQFQSLHKFAKGKPCEIRLPCCDGGRETSVWAHVPAGVSFGKGMKRKPSSLLGAISCNACHNEIDRRTRQYEIDFVLLAFWEGHARSLMRAVEAGLISIKG